jgi:hyperosmotically inducible protein
MRLGYDVLTCHPHGRIIAVKFLLSGAVCAMVLGSTVAIADQDLSSDSAQVGAYVKDSAITTEVKSKLAAEHITSLERIHVDTDKNGVVWLSGSARTREAADKAVSIARTTDHVTSVHSDITIKSAD